jgi:hypothetical protein
VCVSGKPLFCIFEVMIFTFADGRINLSFSRRAMMCSYLMWDSEVLMVFSLSRKVC